MDPRDAKVVIAHDFLETYGGAERVTEEIARAFPNAPVYAVLAREAVARRMGIAERCVSLLPQRDRLFRHYRLATPLLAFLGDIRKLPAADVLISSSYAFAHHLRTRNGAPQICFCHSPMRFAWTMTDQYRGQWADGRIAGAAFNAMTAVVRAQDRRAARRVERFLVASPYTAEQVTRFYGRRAEIIGAPIPAQRFIPSASGGHDGYFLFCGRLIEPYKRVLATIEAFRELPFRLVVVGDGPAYSQARARATPNIEFTGALQDDALVPLMQRCAAAVFPSQDDFGLIALEVMACGRPVLAYASGGANYTMRPGLTGEMFTDATPAGIAEAVSSFRAERYDSAAIRAHALQWDAASFRERIVDSVRELLGAPY